MKENDKFVWDEEHGCWKVREKKKWFFPKFRKYKPKLSPNPDYIQIPSKNYSSSSEVENEIDEILDDIKEPITPLNSSNTMIMYFFQY